jgi:hypothetical protein
MGTGYVAVCLLCGRDVGHIVEGRLRQGPPRPRLLRDGRRLRCGYCHGSVFLQPDPDTVRPDLVAEMEEFEVGVSHRARSDAAHRRAQRSA